VTILVITMQGTIQYTAEWRRRRTGEGVMSDQSFCSVLSAC